MRGADSQGRKTNKAAGIPAALTYRPKWQIALEQVRRALGDGVRFSHLVFDEDYGSVPEFWRELDALGQVGIGEVRANFECWATPPACRSLRAEHAPREVGNLRRHSPVFYQQAWTEVVVKDTTRGPQRWRYQAARVQITDTRRGPNVPSDRRYWLLLAESLATGEIKYFLSNAPASANIVALLQVAFARWHVEKWFERAKQETGFGAFEVRTYDGLLRHWLCARLAMYFLAAQTQRLREKNPQITLEQVARVANTLAEKIWQTWPRSWTAILQRNHYYQWRNEASYRSRRKRRSQRQLK